MAQKTFIGLGTIVSKEGLIATGDVFADTNGKYMVTLDNAKFYDVKVLPKKENAKFYFIKIIQDAKNIVNFTPVTFSDSDSLKLGQTIVTLGGQLEVSISTGIISSLISANLASSTVLGTSIASTTSNVLKENVAINTSMNLTDNIYGGPLLILNGEVIGLRISPNVSDKYNFLPSNILKNEVATYAAIQ